MGGWRSLNLLETLGWPTLSVLERVGLLLLLFLSHFPSFRTHNF